MYGKIFKEIFSSSLMNDSGQLAVYIFMSMVVLCDQDGIVHENDQSLARRIGIKDEQYAEFQSIMRKLESEDEFSNLPAAKGRRIIGMSEVTGGEQTRGWLVVNYEYYLKKASKDDKREKTRERVRRFRDNQKL
jgi:hypothetical protein